MDDLRYGIVGAGMMGVEHLRNIDAIDGAQVVAVADPHDDLLPRVAPLCEGDRARHQAGRLAEALRQLGADVVEIEDVLAQIMVDEKGIHPNLDFPAGPAYYMMGFDIDLFTEIAEPEGDRLRIKVDDGVIVKAWSPEDPAHAELLRLCARIGRRDPEIRRLIFFVVRRVGDREEDVGVDANGPAAGLVHGVEELEDVVYTDKPKSAGGEHKPEAVDHEGTEQEGQDESEGLEQANPFA